MRYHQAEEDVYIVINDTVFEQIRLQAECEYPNENGGMLVGRYSDDRKTLFIEGIIMPILKVTSRNSFIRNPKGLDTVWEDLMKDGLKYVGEWHSHPNGSTRYSDLDLQSMIEIEKEVSISNPVLLIISVEKNLIRSHQFYYYKNRNLMKFKKIIDLKELFGGLQTQMQSKFNVNRNFITHPGSKGDATENHWIEFLKTYLPDRYRVDKAIIIDSKGDVSDQIDIVIYDGMYTPFIFNQNGFLYIPAESVYAVFEVKQDINGNIGYASQKISSVRKLFRTSMGMISSGKKTDARILTKIIGGILTTTSTCSIQSIENQIKNLKGYSTIDLGCIVDTGSFYIDYEEEKDQNNIGFHNNEENQKYIKNVYESRKIRDIHFSKDNVSLFTFFLQLVSYLKAIGTVPAIDINQYLNAIGEKIDIEI